MITSRRRSKKVIEGQDDIVSPSPSPFPLDFGFGIWDLDMGPGFGTWIRDWTWA